MPCRWMKYAPSRSCVSALGPLGPILDVPCPKRGGERMSSPGSNPMDAVSSLMQERQRFEAWLASLESKRAITPPHVYERVRGDYEARLREVIQQLSGRTTELKETVAALTARMSRL